MTPTNRILRRSLLGATVLLLLFASIPSLRSAFRFAVQAAPRPDDQPLRTALASVETAFRRGDPAALRPVLSRLVKIHVSADDLGLGDAYYGPDQLTVLLEALFSDRATQSFTTTSPSAGTRQGGPTTVPARWVFRDRLAAESEVHLAFRCAPEGPRFVVREIREIK